MACATVAELKTKIESVDGQLQTLNRRQRAVIDAQDLIDIQVFKHESHATCLFVCVCVCVCVLVK